MIVLIINSGSSSLKFQVLEMNTEELLCKGMIEKIGEDISFVKQKNNGKSFEESVPIKNHEEALKKVLSLLTHPEFGTIKDITEIKAVGHRVVHGAEAFASSVLITPEVVQALEDNINLAPLHNPANITGIKAAEKILPGIPQVGVFDTAFHQTMPKKAYLYPLPYELYEKFRIRRYGFHGTSHRYVCKKAGELLNIRKRDLCVVSAHIGNGASVAAVKNAKVIDTSMGLTPLEGLVMGTRSGDIDPAIPLFLMRNGFTEKDVDNILNKKSGLFGLTDYLSNDLREVKKAKEDGNELAKLAIEIYSYRLAKYIGSYATAMKCFDVLIFTAGVGENNAEIRSEVCDYLKVFGLELDEKLNVEMNGKEGVISSPNSKVKVMIIPTDEELMIARDTKKIVEELF